MKLNDAKCHFMLFGSTASGTSVNVGTSCIEQSDKEKLLGITLNKNLDFKCHVENICKKAGQKLHALARVAKFMDQEKLQTVMNKDRGAHFGLGGLKSNREFEGVWGRSPQKNFL